MGNSIDDLNDFETMREYRNGGKRRKKYNNRVIESGGQRFDSIAEYNRYQELVILERAGVIFGLKRQVPFLLLPKFTDSQGKKQRAIVYVADFLYKEGGILVIEDVKGGKATQTAAWRLKWKLLQYKHRNILAIFRVTGVKNAHT